MIDRCDLKISQKENKLFTMYKVSFKSVLQLNESSDFCHARPPKRIMKLRAICFLGKALTGSSWQKKRPQYLATVSELQSKRGFTSLMHLFYLFGISMQAFLFDGLDFEALRSMKEIRNVYNSCHT